jgi:hypothetical protein
MGRPHPPVVIACDKREAFAQGRASDEAIQLAALTKQFSLMLYGLLRFARNDDWV